MTTHPPHIVTVSEEGKSRPFWSVMIPTYRPDKKYLQQTLGSVLRQAAGPDQMQIEVVDDCSPEMDVAALVKSIAGDRVSFSSTPKNLGLAGCFNTIIERSHGQWVHILNHDDYVLPGFYKILAQAAERHPEISLLATRCFFIDADGVITGVSMRLKNMEHGTRAPDDWFYYAPFQSPCVAVKRSFYETHGGFRSDLKYTLDCEMWARVISLAGGLLTSDVLACYRQSDANESGRLWRTAENLRDHDRLSRIFAERYPSFDPEKARGHQLARALQMAALYESKNDPEAARASWNYWKENASWMLRLRHQAGVWKRKMF